MASLPPSKASAGDALRELVRHWTSQSPYIPRDASRHGDAWQVHVISYHRALVLSGAFHGTNVCGVHFMNEYCSSGQIALQVLRHSLKCPHGGDIPVPRTSDCLTPGPPMTPQEGLRSLATCLGTTRYEETCLRQNLAFYDNLQKGKRKMVFISMVSAVLQMMNISGYDFGPT